MAPSTDWQERISEDEEQRHKDFAIRIVAIQAKIDEKDGPGRAFHRKQVLGLVGTLEIYEGLPDFASHGLFAQPGTYDIVARLSGGSIKKIPDAIPDVRGFAFSVRGLDGPGALATTTDRQDFALINRETFGFHDTTDFEPFVIAGAKGQKALLEMLIERYGPIGGPKEGARVAKDLFKGFTGFATEPFFSAVPIRCGPYACRVKLEPLADDGLVTAPLDFAADMTNRLAKGPVRYDLRLQFFEDEASTPIEDGMVNWSQDKSPYVTVGRLVLPSQDPNSSDGLALAEQIENDRFDPWSALADHQPLGEIMRARKAAYFPSQKQRHATGT